MIYKSHITKFDIQSSVLVKNTMNTVCCWYLFWLMLHSTMNYLCFRCPCRILLQDGITEFQILFIYIYLVMSLAWPLKLSKLWKVSLQQQDQALYRSYQCKNVVGKYFRCATPCKQTQVWWKNCHVPHDPGTMKMTTVLGQLAKQS